MGFLVEHCTFRLLTPDVLASCRPFSCGNPDLDEFFSKDAPLYARTLLGKTYCYTTRRAPFDIVCAFTVSNDSVRVDNIPNSRKKKVNEGIPKEKRMRRYPAVLIGRLGVSTVYAGRGVGSELLHLLKLWFTEADNKTGCRYLAVDSYNIPQTLGFYAKNGFRPLFSSEEQEAESAALPQPLRTRYMYFDLLDIAES